MKDLTNYNQALELKELEFDEPCLAVFNDSKQFRINSESRNWNDNVKNGDTTSAPTFSQAFRFFREKGYMFNIVNDVSASKDGCYYFDLWLSGQILWETDYIYKTYEEAESACLDKLIEIAKTK